MASETEIAARLERATRSGLASSSLASFSFSQASTMGQLSQPPTLADLLPHLGPPDAPRCPACRASLPFGPRSRICLACTAPLLQSPPPLFTSTLAFRRFSEALHIDGLETKFGEAEEELCLEPEVDVANKFSMSSFSLKVGRQKVLPHVDIPQDEGKSNVESENVKSDVQTPLPSSGDLGGSVTAVKPMDLANVDGEKHAGILDYSAKLEGISLEDFFLKEVKSQAPALAANSDMTSDKFLGSATPMDTSHIKVRKNSLFWDPLSESIIPDGFDLMADMSETSTNKGVPLDNVASMADEDDPFSSWEGDFQSAAPAMANMNETNANKGVAIDNVGSVEDDNNPFSSWGGGIRSSAPVMADVSTASSSETSGPQLLAQPITSRNREVLFGDFSNMSSAGERVETHGNKSWMNGGELSSLDTAFENIFKSDSQRSTDAGEFFGAGWQQSMPHPVVSSMTSDNGQSFSFFTNQSTSLKSSQREDLFDILSSKQTETPIVNNSLDSGGESTFTDDLLMEQPELASALAGRKKKIVGSLLGQLHDLSFLLADKLITRTEGKNKKPDSSG